MQSKALFAVAVVILLASSVLAQKITVDPNVPGSRPAQQAVAGTDTRLAQKVTYEARRKTVSAILSDLSEMTGVAFKAGYNSQDWQVRDRKMNIFAIDVPLVDLMNSIAHVMKFKWEAGTKETTPTYRLYMDRKSLLNAESQKARDDQRIMEQLAQQRNRMLADFENSDSLSEQDLAAMKSEDPYSYILASTGISGGLGGLCREVPGLTEALATGQEMAVDLSQLTPPGQEAALEMIRGMGDLSRLKSPDDPAVDILAQQDIGRVSLIINQDADPGYRDLAFLDIYYNGEHKVVHEGWSLFDPGDEFAQIFGKIYTEVRDDKGSFGEVMTAHKSEFSQAASSHKDSVDQGEPPIQHPDDPALLRKIKIEPKSNRLADVEAALARSGGFALVSDCFDQIKCSSLRTGEVEIRALLDGIANSCRYNWEKSGSIIELRDRNWFAKRSAQIPESRIEDWRQALEKNETLSIDELAQIATLTQEQININIEGDEVLSSTSRSGRSIRTLVELNKDILQAYNGLTKRERERVFSSSGLATQELSPDSRALAEKAARRRNPNYLINQDAQITLHGQRTQQGKQFVYTLTTASDGLEPITWRFTSPRYEPTKDAKPVAEAK